MLSTAVLVGLTNIIIYIIVYKTVYNHIDKDLKKEAYEFAGTAYLYNNTLNFGHPFEWATGSHSSLVIDPIFVQIYDNQGNNLKKSSNLGEANLKLFLDSKNEFIINYDLNNNPVRQIQIPILINKNKVGFVVIAISLKDSLLVLDNLLFTIILTYPFILMIIYFITKLITQKSIQPIHAIIKESEKITRENLSYRIPLPSKEDEIFLLSNKINELISRLEEAFLREKQFTADASHELRTPLSIIRGTLEVLIRKPRTTDEYLEKINYCINETIHMEKLIDQLMIIARSESETIKPKFKKLFLSNLVNEALKRLEEQIKTKKMSVIIDVNENVTVTSDENMLVIILENLISNAIKYSDPNKTVNILARKLDSLVELNITDEGWGMNDKQIKNIFNRFYRADDSRNSAIKGFGLGMSIVKKFCDILNIKISIESKQGYGSIISLKIPAY